MSTTESTQTRREAMQRVAVAGGTLTVPAWVNVVRGATESGSAELTTDATISTETSITATVYEITDDGAESTAEQTIEDGENTYQLAGLIGDESNSHEYYIEFYLTTDDETVTPKIYQADLVLPAAPGQNQDEIAEGNDSRAPVKDDGNIVSIADNKIFQTILIIGTVAGGATLSRNASLPATVGLTVLFFFAIITDVQFLNNLMYLILAGVILSMAMGVMSFVLSGEGS